MLDEPAGRLHQPLLQACQRPALDPLGQPEPPPEMPQVAGQHTELQPHFVSPETTTRQPCPVRGLLALFDPLLGCAALVVETQHRTARQGHVGCDEAGPRKEFAGVVPASSRFSIHSNPYS